MKYLVFAILAIVVCYSCKKENYGYTCTCNDNATGARDTTYTIRVETSGEANFLCKEYEDSAIARGKDVGCILE